MNKRLLMVLGFAVVVSAAASFLLYGLITDQLTNRAKAPTTQVLVATHPLDLGVLIKDGDVKLGPWPGTVPMGALTKPEDAVGRGVLQPILEGEPLVEARLAPRGAGAGLAATIPPGMRAVAVRVNDIVGVAGFVTPGTHVDILIAGNPPGNSGNTGTLTKTLLQNVEVLSAGQNIQKDAEGKPVSVNVVNMLVTPEQAETLSLASNETRIQLILRNPLDKDITKTPGTAIVNLFNGGRPAEPPPQVRVARKEKPAPPPPPPPAPVVTPPPAPPPVAAAPEPPKPTPPIVVEMIHGASKSQVQFKPENTEKGKNPEGKQE